MEIFEEEEKSRSMVWNLPSTEYTNTFNTNTPKPKVNSGNFSNPGPNNYQTPSIIWSPAL